jgi:putative transposase
MARRASIAPPSRLHRASIAPPSRLHAELEGQGVRCSRKRVARLMRLVGVRGCHRRRFRTTRRAPARPSAPDVAPDVAPRTFSASAPDQVWVADLTYVPTRQGFLFLAVVLDAYSRRVVGWSMAAHLRTELVVAALDMALLHRRPAAGVIHHSDPGSQSTAHSPLPTVHCPQSTAHAFQDRCRALGIRALGIRALGIRALGIRSSMGSVGECYDNAMAQSFCATLECDLLSHSSFPTHADARAALFDFLEIFYNRQRRHSALGYLSPDAFERRFLETLVVA